MNATNTVKSSLSLPGGRWLTRVKSCPDAEMRLFCFPYAGGNSQVYQGWAEFLSPKIEVIAIEAPGKGRRLLEAPCRTLDTLCDALIQNMTPLLMALPFSFFGHSNGAAIAFDLASRLHERRLPLPEKLLLSAAPAPWAYRREKPYSTMSDAEFKLALRNFNATPEKLLDDDGVFNLLLPGLRADFSLLENYRYGSSQPLPISAHIFHGEFDEVTDEQLRRWQDHIREPLSFESIAGGHFYIHSHVEHLIRKIEKQLLSSSPSLVA
jgi:medium-chain acyl-[acyl-carrier-protein] hydrolase